MHSMAEVHSTCTGKRQRSQWRILKTAKPLHKKQKLTLSNQNLLHDEYWNDLSKVWLTKSALREFNRRTRATSAIHPFSSHQTFSTATDYLYSCRPEVIKNIKDFARHGGPDLSDIRNCPKPVNTLQHTMGSKRPARRGPKNKYPKSTGNANPETDATTSTNSEDDEPTTMSAYSKNFSQHLIDHGVYPSRYRKQYSGDIESRQNLNERLRQSRPSISSSQFSDGAFEMFAQADEDAVKEAMVKDRVLPIIEGRTQDGEYRAVDVSFNNFGALTNGSLKPAKPDVYYGARPEQLDPNIRQNLNDYIVPAAQDDLPLVPNFFLEAKGQNGSEAVVKRQVRYYGALGARAVHHLQSYAQEESAEHDSHALAITSTYHSGALKIYSHHVAKPSNPGGRLEYHMSQVGAYAMTHDRETFRKGATAYRNARDWAREHRDQAIDNANQSVSVKTPDRSFISTTADNNDFQMTNDLPTSIHQGNPIQTKSFRIASDHNTDDINETQTGSKGSTLWRMISWAGSRS